MCAAGNSIERRNVADEVAHENLQGSSLQPTSLSPQRGEGLRVRGDDGQERVNLAGPNARKGNALPSSFSLLVRTVPTVIATTIAASEMIRRGENHQSVRIKIIISDDHSQRSRRGSLPVKRHYALATKARAIARFNRNARKQFGRHVYRLAPTRTFVGGAGAELAIIRSST